MESEAGEEVSIEIDFLPTFPSPRSIVPRVDMSASLEPIKTLILPFLLFTPPSFSPSLTTRSPAKKKKVNGGVTTFHSKQTLLFRRCSLTFSFALVDFDTTAHSATLLLVLPGRHYVGFNVPARTVPPNRIWGFPSPLDGGGRVGLEPNRFTLKVVPILISRLYQVLTDQDVLAVDVMEGY